MKTPSKIKVNLVKIIIVILGLSFVGLIISGLIYNFKSTLIGLGISGCILALFWVAFILGFYNEEKKYKKENK
jgi:hypothetical protein